MKDYRYTIHREGRQLLQRQVFEGVGSVMICENRAAKIADVAAMTVYGNYCYHWDCTSDIGMVLRSSDDYLMDKFLDGHGEKRVLDIDATVDAILAQERAAGEIALVTPYHLCRKGLERCLTLEELLEWAGRWQLDAKEVQSCCVYGYSEAARMFMAHVLPLIRESAKELERMRAGILM